MLKPCPFCGGIAEIQETHIYKAEAIRVKCIECSASTKPILINHPQLTYSGLDETTRFTLVEAIDEAERMWNRRTS